MASTSTQPTDTGKPKPETPSQAPTSTPRVVSARVFNDFAAI